MSTALLDVHALRQSFPRADGGEHLVLERVAEAEGEGHRVVAGDGRLVGQEDVVMRWCGNGRGAQTQYRRQPTE